MPELNILISGAGIAGGVFAFWLLRAYPDANITIVERHPSLRLQGASVDIRSSAVDIIKWMGVEQQIRDNTTNEEGVEFVNAQGKAFATIRATGDTEYQSITSEFEIFRGALAKIFLDPVLDKVKVVYDETVESYDQHDDHVNVTFAKSKEVRTYDLLVAADGFGSRIRGMMLGTKPAEQIHSECVHVAYFVINHDMLNGSKLAKWYNTTGGRSIFLRPDPHPSGRTRGHFMNVSWRSDKAASDKFNTALREGEQSYKKLMVETFTDAGWLAPEVLKGMHETDDFYCSLFAQVRSPKIQDNRVVLLGDAGYATPGFGTSLAIMGGYVLAGELLNNKGDVQAAARRYEELMMPFAKASQGDDIFMQLFNPQTWWGIWIKNTLLWAVTSSRLDKLAIWAATWLGIKEKKLDMPNYPWPTQ